MAKFIITGILSELLYLSFVFVKFLRENHFPESNIATIDLQNDIIIYFLLVAVLLVIFLLYLYAYRLILSSNIKFAHIMLFAAIFSAGLFFIKPFPTYDVYTYINQSRKMSDFSQNPYEHNENVFLNDDWQNVKMTSWSVRPSVYGPAFTYYGSILTKASRNNFLAAVYLFKFSFLLLHLLLSYLLYRSFGKIAAFLYSWNPLVNFELVLNGHNDILVIFLLFLSIMIIYKKTNLSRILISWLLLLVSVFIKYTTIFYLPIFFLGLLFLNVKKKEKIKFIFLSLALSISTIFVLFFPFWTGPAMLLPLTDYTHNNVNLFSSPGIIAISGIVHLAAKPFMAIDAKAMHKILGLSRNICLGIFALIYAYLCLDIFKKRKVLNADMLLKSLLAATLAFFILAINWLMPWYFPQMIILAIIIFSITKKQNCLILIQGATLYAVLYYVLLR